MVRPEFKDTVVNRFVSHVSWSKLAALGLILSALALGGCGRKGPLDLPPGAALTPSHAEVEGSNTQTYRSQTSPGSSADETLFAPAGSQGKQMIAPRGEKKRIILDPILD
ncbi:MAG: lipoprotein [Afipia sp.]|nr:lipoprotein [Afipia sp.]